MYWLSNKFNNQTQKDVFDINNQQTSQSSQTNAHQISCIKDILGLPLSRQQYLKSLSTQQLHQTNQSKYLFSHNKYFFIIAKNYQNQFTNQQLKRQIIKINTTQTLIQPVTILSIMLYMWKVQLLQKYSPFRGSLRNRYHWVLPPLLLFGAYYKKRQIKNRKQQILRDKKYESQLMKIVRKFLCLTNSQQRKKAAQMQYRILWNTRSKFRPN